MNLVIVNQTAVSRSYLSGAVTVAGTIGATTTVSSQVQQLALATEGLFKQDIFANNIYITDGTNAFGVNDGIDYLNLIILNTGAVSDGVGNDLTSTTINSKQRLDVNLSAEGIDNTAVPFGTLLVGGVDPTGKLQSLSTLPSGEQFTRDVINVSSQYRAQSVTTTAAQALGGATILVNRKVISITPTNGTIYWGTNSSVTTTTGTPLFAFQTLVLSFTDNVPVWLIAASTVDVRILEAS